MTARLLAVLAAVFAGSTAAAQASSVQSPRASRSAFPPGRTETINIVQWDANQLPRIYQRSEQPPLTDDDLTKLSKAGFDPARLVEMIEQRRCACDASAEGLIRLKQEGVAPEVISAVSLHALRPNRSLQLLVTLDFTGIGQPAGGEPAGTGMGIPRDSFLYFFVDDGSLTRVFSADVGELLRRPFSHEAMTDHSDLLLARDVRRVKLAGELPLKTYGRHSMLVTSAARPTVTHPEQLSRAERARGQSYTFEYPRASIQRVCRLNVAYRRDPVLAHRWTFAGSRFECEWD